MEKIIKHYKKAQAIKRGFVPFNWDEYEIHVKCAYSYIVAMGLLDSNDQTIKNTIRLYNTL